MYEIGHQFVLGVDESIIVGFRISRMMHPAGKVGGDVEDVADRILAPMIDPVAEDRKCLR